MNRAWRAVPRDERLSGSISNTYCRIARWVVAQDVANVSGHRVPEEPDQNAADAVSAALFAVLTEDEREELLEYLAWYRARRRSSRGADRAS